LIKSELKLNDSLDISIVRICCHCQGTDYNWSQNWKLEIRTILKYK